MITSQNKDGFHAVTQLEHSALVGIIAANWGGDAVALPLPRRPMLVMAAEHDLCWVYHDHRPRIDPDSGIPYDYASLPYDAHVKLYREGARYLSEREPYGGLMLSLHGTGIYNGRHGTDAEMVRPTRSPEEAQAVKTYLADGEAFRDTLRTQIEDEGGENIQGLDNKVLWTNYHLMQVWDRLGLLLSKGIAESFVIEPVPLLSGDANGSIRFSYQGDGLYLADPYPFAVPEVHLSVNARRLPRTTFSDDKEYQEVLDTAPNIFWNYRFRSNESGYLYLQPTKS
ncbi:MAG: DUF3891 family protein [Opitutales bacterium]|nr:DUF3891 family protein [Opitutales bacterium]NRA28296.1 DUF3891 family protein [Opitutales bacterium]